MPPHAPRLAALVGLGLASAPGCDSNDPVSQAPETRTTILTVDAGRLAPGELVDVLQLAHRGGHRTSPVEPDSTRPVTLVEVVDVDVLIIDSDRGRERVRVFGLTGTDPRWPRELDSWIATEGRSRFEAWLREPGTELVERPPEWAASGWPSALIDHDREGLRACRLERRGPEGAVSVREQAVENGWAVGSTPWTDTLALATALPLRESTGTGGLRELASTRELVDRYRADARAFSALDATELQERATSLVAAVAEYLDWQPPEPVLIQRLNHDEAVELFEEFQTERNALKREWGRTELEHLSQLNEARGLEPFESLQLTLYEPDVKAREMVDELDGFSPAGPTFYLVEKSELAGWVAEHIIVHEVLHEYQEHQFDRHGLFPAPGIFSTLLEPHAEWHTQRIMRAIHPELDADVPIAYFNLLLLFSRLLDELQIAADEALHHFYADRWDAHVFADVMDGTLSLQEYLFHEHQRSSFAGLDFRIGPEWSDDAVVIVTNTTADAIDAQLHGIWLLDTSVGLGAFATVRTIPVNVRLPAYGELHLRLSDEALLPGETIELVTGLFSPTPSLSDR